MRRLHKAWVASEAGFRSMKVEVLEGDTAASRDAQWHREGEDVRW